MLYRRKVLYQDALDTPGILPALALSLKRCCTIDATACERSRKQEPSRGTDSLCTGQILRRLLVLGLSRHSGFSQTWVAPVQGQVRLSSSFNELQAKHVRTARGKALSLSMACVRIFGSMVVLRTMYRYARRTTSFAATVCLA